MTAFETPVAMFNFNRPHLTRQVFEVVRKIKPKRLLIVADGPRADRPEDARLCAEVRSIFEEIDWECEVSKNFADTNMGSFKRNSSGLDWVFDTVDEAIILEDDCVPSLSFFPYCAELLERYRDDNRVSVISGNNFSNERMGRSGYSYFFSVYTFIWGWASWRRVWETVDIDISRSDEKLDVELIKHVFHRGDERNYWLGLNDRTRRGEQKNAWDLQLLMASMRNDQLAVLPRHNLVSNVGFGPDAANCRDINSPLSNLPSKDLEFPLNHPKNIKRSRSVDCKLFNKVFKVRYPFRRRVIDEINKRGHWLPVKVAKKLIKRLWPKC